MKTQTHLEAPDGGWGIFICIGLSLSFISSLAALPSFGLVFGDFLKSIGAEASDVALITNAFFCALSFAGLFSGSLFNRFGLRAIGLLGGCLYFLGSFIQIFVNSIWLLLVAFSIFQGIGFGLMVPTAYTTFNLYFVKKRVMWMSFAQALIGLGTMSYPVVIQILLETYGFRGCLLMLAGINSHAILGMLLMHPVEWHMKKVTIQMDEEMIVINKSNDDECENEKEYSTNIKDPHEEDANCMYKSQNLSSEFIYRRSSSITSLGNCIGPIVVRDASPALTLKHSMQSVNVVGDKIQTPRNWWLTIVDFLDLTLLKQPIYVNIVLGMSFALYSDITFFTLQPLYLFELGFTKSDTASIIAIGAAADLASRIFLAFSTVFIQMPSRYIYLAGSFFIVIGRFAFLNVFNYFDMACTTAVLGFLRTWVHVPLPLVLAEYLPKERFSTGYGLFAFLQGNIMFAIGPSVGYLQDQTKNFVLTFHCLNFFMALCAVPWLIEIFYLKFRGRPTLTSNN